MDFNELLLHSSLPVHKFILQNQDMKVQAFSEEPLPSKGVTSLI